MTEVELLINWLERNAHGKRNAKKGWEIGTQLFNLPNRGQCGAFYQKVRRLATEAVVEHGAPICADQEGFFIPATKDEAQKSIERLNVEAQRMAERRDHLIDNLHRRFKGDL